MPSPLSKFQAENKILTWWVFSEKRLILTKKAWRFNALK